MTNDRNKVANVEKDVLSVYQKVNPSTFLIEEDAEVFKQRMTFMENLFLHMNSLASS